MKKHLVLSVFLAFFALFVAGQTAALAGGACCAAGGSKSKESKSEEGTDEGTEKESQDHTHSSDNE